MQVSLLSIQNFRGIQSGSVRFLPHTVLIGPINSGKTTILEALALVLGRDRPVSMLTEHDFFGSDPQPADRITIVATVTGFDPEDPSKHPDWFGHDRAVPKWLDRKSGRIIPEQAGPCQSLACQIAFAARFDHESLEVETARYFCDDEQIDVFADNDYIRVPRKLIRDLGFFLIPATRTWNRMLSFSSELFKRVISSDDGMPFQAVMNERNRLRMPQNPLESDPNIKPIIDEVSRDIRRIIGASTVLNLRLTATDSTSILEAIVPHFLATDGHLIPSKRQGSGLLSLQSVLLILHLGRKYIESGESFCLALEEPELHLSPGTQRRLLAQFQSLSTQTIVSTHSSLVAGHSEPTSVLVMRNTGGRLRVAPMLDHPLERTTISAIRNLFQINRVEVATAMMSEIILVPEGRIDYLWLILLTRVIELYDCSDGICLFGFRVGVVPTHNAHVKQTCEVLSKAHPKVCGLLDGDDAGKKYATELSASSSGVHTVLTWPKDWMIEDVIGWIIEADECAVMEELSNELPGAPQTCSGLVAALKSDKRKCNGMKGDSVSYEVIANGIATHPSCSQRACTLLNAIALACALEETPHFEMSADGPPPQMVFKPCP